MRVAHRRRHERDNQDEGFTLIELLVVIAISGFIVAAMAAAMMGTLKILIGLDTTTTAAPGVQNANVVTAQLDASTTFPDLMREVTSDLLNSKPADVSLANSFAACTRPGDDPALPTTSVLFTATITDSTGTVRRAIYEYSADVPRHLAHVVRYECAADASGTTAEVVAEGLNSTRLPTATMPQSGLLRLSLYSVTGREYTLDAHTRVPGPDPLATDPAQGMTLLVAQDTDVDARIDVLRASFGTSSPEAACTAAGAWSIRPTGGPSIASASWSGSEATLTVTNAPADDTSVDAFRVSFLPPTGCEALAAAVDVTPVDEAAPVLVEVANGAGTADGTLAAGDEIVLTFSERLRPDGMPADGKTRVTLARAAVGSDRLELVTNSPGGNDLTGAAADTGATYVTTPMMMMEWMASTTLAADGESISVVLDDGGCLTPLCETLLTTSASGDLDVVTPADTLIGFDDLSAVAGHGIAWPAGYRLF